jgi:hypothetical protein
MTPTSSYQQLHSVLARLVTVVAEQQFTLQSMGWHEPLDPHGWTKAGARKHQYEDVEAAMREAFSLLEPLEPEGEKALLIRLLRIKHKAMRFTKQGHTQPCGCMLCDLDRDIAGDKHVQPDPILGKERTP